MCINYFSCFQPVSAMNKNRSITFWKLPTYSANLMKNIVISIKKLTSFILQLLNFEKHRTMVAHASRIVRPHIRSERLFSGHGVVSYGQKGYSDDMH